MKFFDIIKSANQNLLRNKGRSFLTILAIFIGSFTIILTTGINTGVNDYIGKQLDSAGGEGYLEIMPSATMEAVMGMMGGGDGIVEYNPEKNSSEMQTISQKDVDKISQIDGIISAKAFQNVSVEFISSDLTDKRFTISVNMLPSDNINVDIAEPGRQVNANSDQPEITLSPNYAEALGFESDADAVGQLVTLTVVNALTKEQKSTTATVVGVQNPSVVSMGRSWINEPLHSKLLALTMEGVPEQMRGRVITVTAEFDTTLGDEGLQRIKDELKELGFEAMTIRDQVGIMITFFDAITMVLTIFGVIALIAASIGIVNTLFMAVQERTREIGLMKAMGLGKGKIRVMFSLEAVALGFWGSVLGVAVAYVAGQFANKLAVETFLADLPGFTLVKFDPITVVVIIVIVMFIAFLAGTLPARRASKLDPIEALRYE